MSSEQVIFLPPSDRRNIPDLGACILISNHITGQIERIILEHIIPEMRPDFLFIDTRRGFGDRNLPAEQKKKWKELLPIAKDAIQNGSCVGFIPSRKRNTPSDWPIQFHDRRWRKRIIKMIRSTDAPVMPVCLNIETFLVTNKLYDALKDCNTYNDLKDVLCDHKARVVMRIGRAIDTSQVDSFDSVGKFTAYLRARIAALRTSVPLEEIYKPKSTAADIEDIAAPISPDLIAAEMAALPEDQRLAQQGEFDVWMAESNQITETLKEIGRLREITFREVGEGTNKDFDLDEFDIYYSQLIIWDRENKKIVGGYRIGKGREIFERYGIEGFYISSLFKIGKGLYPYMLDGAELGRSYVVKEYQRHRLPLFLLWKGIFYFLLRYPEYKYLMGPVSISKNFSDLSKSLIVAFVSKFYFDQDLAKHIKPRKPFRYNPGEVDMKVLMDSFEDEIKNLDLFISEIEPGHIKMPVLIKKYIQQNAKFIAFNLDPNFNDALDGFMILDVRDIPQSTIDAMQKEM